mgnify:CR=1 FL=1
MGKDKLIKNGGKGTNVGNALRFLAKQGKVIAPSLLDLAGKLLIEKTIDAGALQNRTILDISGLQNGYYLIEVNNGLENSISKLSVIR